MIRTLTPEEAQHAIDWAAREGWNPGPHDLRCFLAQDAGLFLGAFVDGALAAVISATRYGADFGFIGFYIAAPAHRGQGHGIAVWREGMVQLAGRVVGLDGVVAQQDNYRKSGFALAWRNIRFGGVPPALPRRDPQIVPAGDVPLDAILALDAPIFPAPRPAFWRAWLHAPGHVARVKLRDGEAVGLGVLRPAREGSRIGPLVAASAADAEALLAALLADAPAGPVFLDVPEPNAEAMALAQALGLVPVFETARMYAGAAPPVAMQRLFCVTSLELG